MPVVQIALSDGREVKHKSEHIKITMQSVQTASFYPPLARLLGQPGTWRGFTTLCLCGQTIR